MSLWPPSLASPPSALSAESSCGEMPSPGFLTLCHYYVWVLEPVSISNTSFTWLWPSVCHEYPRNSRGRLEGTYFQSCSVWAGIIQKQLIWLSSCFSLDIITISVVFLPKCHWHSFDNSRTFVLSVTMFSGYQMRQNISCPIRKVQSPQGCFSKDQLVAVLVS